MSLEAPKSTMTNRTAEKRIETAGFYSVQQCVLHRSEGDEGK